MLIRLRATFADRAGARSAERCAIDGTRLIRVNARLRGPVHHREVIWFKLGQGSVDQRAPIHSWRLCRRPRHEGQGRASCRARDWCHQRQRRSDDSNGERNVTRMHDAFLRRCSINGALSVQHMWCNEVAMGGWSPWSLGRAMQQTVISLFIANDARITAQRCGVGRASLLRRIAAVSSLAALPMHL